MDFAAASEMVCSRGNCLMNSKPMTDHPSKKTLYKRVRQLTNIGQHAEANALFNDLQARALKDVVQHGE